MRSLITLAGLILAAATPVLGAERTLALEPTATRVAFLLPATGHDVEGAFELVAGQVTFDTETGVASGEIRIDARHAETGNAKRDRTMHGSVLETEVYPFFVFHPAHIRGAVPEQGEGKLELEGTVAIHGAEHPLTLPVTVHVTGDQVQAEAAFPVPFIDWGLHNPSFMFLRVAKVVDISVTTAGTLAPSAAAASRAAAR